jgi:hypothetical protein
MTLADYIRELIERAAAAEPASMVRLRGIVGERSAIIKVDEEAVLVGFVQDWLSAETIPAGASMPPADGVGETDRQTVLGLLAGRIEVTQAIETDRLRLRGTTDGIVRMSRAIEILIDVAVRAPPLQQLSVAYRSDPTRAPLTPQPPDPGLRRAALRAAELAMLGRLGLLPDADRQS